MKSFFFSVLSLIQISSFAYDDVCELPNKQRVRISREVVKSDKLSESFNRGAAENVEIMSDLKLPIETIPAGWYNPGETAFLNEGRCYAAQVFVAVTKEHGNHLRVNCMSTNASFFKSYTFPLKCGF